MPARAGRLISGDDLARRCAGLAWEDIAAVLDARGYATTGPLLQAAECAALVDLYAEETRFRSRVDMSRAAFHTRSGSMRSAVSSGSSPSALM